MSDFVLFKKYIILISIFSVLIFSFLLIFNFITSASKESLLYAYFEVPFEDDVPYVITSKFGTRVDPIDNNLIKHHSGIDISAPANTKILSTADGTVYQTGYSESLGNYVYIKHDFDNVILFSIYAHLLDNSIIVNEGDVVKAKQEIATIGSTGRSTGIHLHFSISNNTLSFQSSDLIDPITILEK